MEKIQEACASAACSNSATLRCPKCIHLGIRESSYFCSQECFKRNWKIHKSIHKTFRKAMKSQPVTNEKCTGANKTGPAKWPRELLEMIFCKLNLLDLVSASDVCKPWSQIALGAEVALTINRAVIRTERNNFLIRLAELLKCEKYRNLIVEADIRDLSWEEVTFIFPLLQKCAKLRSLNFDSLDLPPGEGDNLFWETITSFRGTLKNLDAINGKYFSPYMAQLHNSLPKPRNMLTGLIKISTYGYKIFAELILANKDTLREIHVAYMHECDSESFTNVISQCAHLTKVSIAHKDTEGYNLVKNIPPSIALEFTLHDFESLKSISGDCPHVTKMVASKFDTFEPANFNKLANFQNVKELTLGNLQIFRCTVALSAVEFASQLENLKLLKIELFSFYEFDSDGSEMKIFKVAIKLDKQVEILLRAFDKVPSLSKIILITFPASKVGSPEIRDRVELAKRLRDRGYEATFVKIYNEYYFIIPKQKVKLVNNTTK